MAWDGAIAAIGAPMADREHMVLSIDIDDLKLFNDQFGHAGGDMVIRAAADILRSTLRADDSVARVGGDEFLALLPNSGEREARVVIRRIYGQMRSRRVTDHGLTPYLSVGWAAFDGDWASTICSADEQMYALRRRRRRTAPPRHAAAPQRSARARSRRTDTSDVA